VSSRFTLDYGLRFYWVQPQYDQALLTSNFLPNTFDQSQAVRLYVGSLNGSTRVALDPVTGQTLPEAFIGRIVPQSGSLTNGLHTGADPTVGKYLIKDRGILYAPRIGLTYDLTGKQDFILRAGGGAFYDRFEGNIAFGLRQENAGRDEIVARVAQMLDLTRLQGFGERRIHQLSGGQRQRVALARSLIKRPRVLLLDEPLAALDKKLRAETQFELMELQRKLGTTFVIVTHDQEEAMIVADRIAVMNQGRLMQVATPAEIYEQPNSRWVADFIGEVTIIEGRMSVPGTIESALGPIAVAGRDSVTGKTMWLALRPEKIGMSGQRPAGEKNAVAGTVAEVGYRGEMSAYKVRVADGSLMKVSIANVNARGRPPFAEGDAVWLSWPPDAGILLTS